VSGAGRGTLDGAPGNQRPRNLVADIYGLCRRCGDTTRRDTRGLCGRCGDWAWRNGRLEDYPRLTDPWTPGQEAIQARVRDRVEDFSFLLAERVPFREACRRTGVTTRTGLRYKARLRAQDAGEAAA
jgi:hypothetical protein